MKRNCRHGCSGMHRRTFLADVGMGFTGLALGAMLQRDGYGATPAWAPPDGKPHFGPKAKSVIWIFLNGGLSHMESFDPKPMLNKYAGKTIDETPYKDVSDPKKLALARVVVVNDANGQQRNILFPLQIGYKKSGQSGIEVSDWFPHLRECIDDVAVVRSMYTTDNNHGAQVQFHTGRHSLDGDQFPTLGGWVHYGLGSLNDNLPQFVSMGERPYWNRKDARYLGPEHDAVPLVIDPKNPIDYGSAELPRSADEGQTEFDLVSKLNDLRGIEYPDDPAMAARIKSYELAFRMQRSIPELMDFADETEATQKLYGLDQKHSKSFGSQMLAARRMVERGVRFIQVQHGGQLAGAGSWDAHSGLKGNHERNCKQIDQPIAALLKDLKQRGLLNETIVLLASEFGRTPGSQNEGGRDHHIYGFSVCMAGGGIKGGTVHGATDEIGFHAVENRHYVTDIHATIMKQMGLSTHKLEVPGRKRLEIDHGKPIDEIIA